MFGGMGDMAKMMKQVGDMKAKMGAVEKELQNTVIKSASKDGSIEVEITGKMKLKSVKILKDLDSDRGRVEKAILEAVGSGLEEVSNIAQKKLTGVTGGIKLPGM
jgi:DNA-binding YbaB/EbfC family protein